MLCSLRRFGVHLSAVLLALTFSAFAQFNASIQGTVMDPSGAVIPGATITVTNQATNVGRTTQSSANGFYNVTSLPPGAYTVAVKAAGFEDDATTISIQRLDARFRRCPDGCWNWRHDSSSNV